METVSSLTHRGTARLPERCPLLSAGTLSPQTLLRNDLVACRAPEAERMREVPTLRLHRQVVYPGLKPLAASPPHIHASADQVIRSQLFHQEQSPSSHLSEHVFKLLQFETTWPS